MAIDKLFAARAAIAANKFNPKAPGNSDRLLEMQSYFRELSQFMPKRHIAAALHTARPTLDAFLRGNLTLVRWNQLEIALTRLYGQEAAKTRGPNVRTIDRSLKARNPTGERYFADSYTLIEYTLSEFQTLPKGTTLWRHYPQDGHVPAYTDDAGHLLAEYVQYRLEPHLGGTWPINFAFRSIDAWPRPATPVAGVRLHCVRRALDPRIGGWCGFNRAWLSKYYSSWLAEYDATQEAPKSSNEPLPAAAYVTYELEITNNTYMPLPPLSTWLRSPTSGQVREYERLVAELDRARLAAARRLFLHED